ncbi:TIGR02328 family protein [uncultured Lactobacillus sp.]|uniref:TIGR02328 family protein n=1 Tax=uncultured Lactobacillus sp. TaxID=153152 RepID=UPI0025D5B7C8|nr:TIGR02328 family protein [uncultured Lactobacillus sp.]
MGLWHQDLIWLLPRQQLLGQHVKLRLCEAENGAKNHATVNYVFQYSPYKVYQFHLLVLAEMQRRHYHPDRNWFDPYYRGQYCARYETLSAIPWTNPIYPEHDDTYLQICFDNLHQKGINLY